MGFFNDLDNINSLGRMKYFNEFIVFFFMVLVVNLMVWIDFNFSNYILFI